MSAPEPVAELDVCGVIRIKKSRGPGWIVGEPFGRKRNGVDGVSMVRPSHHGGAFDAVICGLSRALSLLRHKGARKPASELLGGAASVLAGDLAEVLGEFGPRLQALRELRGLSRRELAAMVGTDRVMIWRIERGKQQPRVDTAARILRVLGMGYR